MLPSTVQYLECNLLLLVIGASDLPLLNSVPLSTLRLLVINTSLSSPANSNDAALTSDKCQVAAARQLRVDNIWQSQRTNADVGPESPPAFDVPVRAYLSEYCYNVWYGKNRMMSLPDGEKNMFIRFDRMH